MMGKEVSPTSYEIGYQKPPKHTQFKKGQSGNPKGRKKGSRSSLSYQLPPELYREAVLREAYREISINEPGGQVTMRTMEAILRSIMLSAAKGKTHAQRLAMHLISEEERKRRLEAEDSVGKLIDHKLHWEEKLARGYKGEIPYPHPDQIKTNMKTGVMEVIGPLSKEEHEEYELHRAMLARKLRERDSVEESLKGKLKKTERTELAKELENINAFIRPLEALVGRIDSEEEMSFYEAVKKYGNYDALMARLNDESEKIS